jgi:gamma-glutamylcyclotransferase (GGCT)/AIG2-like uncharacterized protein YtfP
MRSRGQETDCLFVYGTLMRASGHPMAMRLAAECASLGAATAGGRLYDLGAYPGALPAEAAGDRVHGEVLRLIKPAHSLRWLDAYEGCGEHDAEPHGFRRVMVGARLTVGRGVNAWIYYYQGPLDRARRLDGGRYLPAKPLIRQRS